MDHSHFDRGAHSVHVLGGASNPEVFRAYHGDGADLGAWVWAVGSAGWPCRLRQGL